MGASTIRVCGAVVFVAAVAVLPSRPGLLAASTSPPAAMGSASKPNMSDQALRMLQEGNTRFIEGKSIHPNTDVFRIGDTGQHGQHPFATIVACADSRVAVERLFDRGVGDLFVVRVAGAIGGPNQTGSVEYACEHLGTQLVLVLGHTRCGAVSAAVAGMGNADAGKNIGSLLERIAPAVETTRANHPDLSGDELVDAAVRQNVWETIEDMFKGSAIVRDAVTNGRAKLVGAVYDIKTGRVEWLGTHPAQAGLLKADDTDQATSDKADPNADTKTGAKNTTKPTSTAARPAPTKSAPSASKPNEADAGHGNSHASTPH